jgi:hypothetical protein
MSSGRRRGCALLERDVLEIERRLALHRENTPKRIAVELRVHPNTISTINSDVIRFRRGWVSQNVDGRRPRAVLAACSVAPPFPRSATNVGAGEESPPCS